MKKEKNLKIFTTNYTENVELEEGYAQVVVWTGAVMQSEAEIPLIEKYLFDEIGARVKFLEVMLTFPNPGEPNTGGRSDIFLAVHSDDISIFAIPRFQYGIRWLEDIYLNKQGYIYPTRVEGYYSWSEDYRGDDDELEDDDDVI